MSFRIVLPLLAIVATGPVAAQSVAQLSPAEREAVLEEAASRAPINGAPGIGDGKIHGEMGIEVGSNGSRAVYGSTIIPLGQNATLGLAFSDSNSGRWRPR